MIMKKLVLFTLAASILLCLCGCSNNASPAVTDPVNIVFVLGIADGEAVITGNNIRELSDLPSQPGSNYAFVSAESNPTTIGKSDTVADLSDRGYTQEMMKRVRDGMRADLNGRVEAYTPCSAEIDIAAATIYAVRTLNSNAIPGRKNIIVYCASGRSSTGLINLSETPIYKLDVDASLPVIAEKMHTDMKTVDEVICYYIGDCSSQTQMNLSTEEKAKMREFYGKLFKALGAKNVVFRDKLPDAGYYSFPDTPVTRMDVHTVTSGLKELKAVTPEALEETALQEALVFPESKVKYLPDSDEFLDPTAAAEAIQPAADYLLQHRDLQILLYGTCAGDSDSASAIDLARSRAERVKEVLMNAGVDEYRIKVISVSVYDDPYYQFGLGTSAAASVNRKCVLMDIRTPEAERLLACSKP